MREGASRDLASAGIGTKYGGLRPVGYPVLAPPLAPGLGDKAAELPSDAGNSPKTPALPPFPVAFNVSDGRAFLSQAGLKESTYCPPPPLLPTHRELLFQNNRKSVKSGTRGAVELTSREQRRWPWFLAL